MPAAPDTKLSIAVIPDTQIEANDPANVRFQLPGRHRGDLHGEGRLRFHDAQGVYDQLVAPNANVKMVFSGHVGTEASRTDSPPGHKVLSFLLNDLGAAYNPVRVLEIDTVAGTVTSKVVSPNTGAVTQTSSATGMTFVG